jgi:four helix bundle protein
MPGARHFSELLIWRLADETRVELFKLTGKQMLARNLRLQGQAEDAINSVCHNIAEGFGCDTHREFARFLGFSRRSLNEVQDAPRAAELKGYVTAADCVPIRMLLRRLYPALNCFMAHLRRSPDYRHRPASESRTDKPSSRTDLQPRDRTDKRKRDRTDQR